MSEKILSVIIPSYNSKPYLDKCLGSLVVPELMDKIDVIVVNDGSTDVIDHVHTRTFLCWIYVLSRPSITLQTIGDKV